MFLFEGCMVFVMGVFQGIGVEIVCVLVVCGVGVIVVVCLVDKLVVFVGEIEVVGG